MDFALNIFAIILLLSLLVVIHLTKGTLNIKSALFRTVIYGTIGMNVLEILSWVFNEKIGQLNWYLNYMFNFLFTALGTVVVSLWACYIDYMLHKNYERLKTKWYYFLPPIIMIVLSIINIFYPILFGIDSANSYFRLPLIWSSIPLTLIMYVYLLIMVIKKPYADNKKILFGVIIFLLFPISSAILQLMVLGLTIIWPSTALAIMICYIIFETTSNYRDYLTGLNTRDRAEEVIERFIFKKRMFSVIMIDLDGFKSINDNFGHHFGDQVLIEVSRILESTFKENSMVSRYGGDEFIIVTNLDNLNALYKKRDELKESIKRSENEHIRKLKLSYGVAICDTPEDCSINEIIIEADNNMYKDKETIKN